MTAVARAAGGVFRSGGPGIGIAGSIAGGAFFGGGSKRTIGGDVFAGALAARAND